MRISLNPSRLEDYAMFLKIKSLPKFTFEGRTAVFPDEYAEWVGASTPRIRKTLAYEPSPFLFDYQRDIARVAIRKGKYSVFADCGLGKSIIIFEFAKHAAKCIGENKAVLIVTPLMVVQQMIEEAKRFYGCDLPIEQIHARDLGAWMTDGQTKIGITNYDSLHDDIPQGNLGALILDESGMMKSHYGKWGNTCLRLGKGLDWKLACTGTPAPNDRIEYANHAVFMDVEPTVNSFLAKYFINRGQTQERWELKAHALQSFYKSLGHWAIFLTNPATYGWKDNCESIPPIQIHIQDVAMSGDQMSALQETTGQLFAVELGGIVSRSKLSQISKGRHKGENIEAYKPAFIKKLVDSWPDESTIIWCHHNEEQHAMERLFPDAASIEGCTPYEKRMELLGDFKSGRRKVMISKPKCLGLGLNLQIATRQVFSGINDSYESFYQAIKRSNRYGSIRPLNVHLPVTDLERPMIENVLRKAKRVQSDTEIQEQIFKESNHVYR